MGFLASACHPFDKVIQGGVAEVSPLTKLDEWSKQRGQTSNPLINITIKVAGENLHARVLIIYRVCVCMSYLHTMRGMELFPLDLLIIE